MSAFLIKNLAICLSGLVVFLIVSEPAFAQNRYFIDDQTVALGGVGVESVASVGSAHPSCPPPRG